MEEVVTEVNHIVRYGVDYLKDRLEVGEIIEVRVTAGQGQVLEQVQTETEVGVLSVENMIISHKNAQ